ncbi:hypothetical protein L6164_001543 [Bauhinia variegata]|uniref:Uncharacterized protein n=1 Tax=Bauhinia variegata TaxID=167791 RepID=A0ACB9QGY2_BAUVA|nr:hypothetical protein L6164_001543 [Bauhinia variegata]
MEVVFAIAGVVIDRTVAPLGRQLGYMFGYKSNVEELKSKIEKLEDERGNVKELVDGARRNGEEIADGVKKWLERVHIVSGERARKMVMAIAEIQAEGNFKRVSYRVVAPWIDGISPAGYMAFESRTLVLNEVDVALRDPTVNMVGVYGLAGVGKTNLVKEVARKAQEDKFFDRVVMVVVTQNVEADKIQKEIAEMLGLKFDEESELIRAGRLSDRFKQEKNILVILDYLWAWLDLGKIGIPFGNDHKGCKLLLTSRNQQVLSHQMDTQKSFLMEVLIKEEAWKLFKEMAGLDDSNSNTELLSTAAEVARECAGLPVAIVTVARALKKKSLFEWRDALRQLKSPTSRNITGMKEVVDSSIKLSYDHLESDELKSTFLLCAFMGHDASTFDLLKYCVGLGLFKGIFAIDEARDRMQTLYLRINRPLLCAIMNIEKQFQNCVTMALDYSDIPKLPEVLDCPRLQFFRIFRKDPSLQIADDFFERLGELKVLDLTDIHFSSLPSSITALRNLSTLCLDWCVLEDIAIVGELKNLKILSFLRSDIKQLPGEIKNLTQLKLLDLTNCSKLEIIPPNIISSLTSLEELYMGNSFVRWQDEKSDRESSNASLAELRNLPYLTTLEVCIRDASIFPQYSFFKKLKRYRILVGDIWSWPGKFKNLRTLKLKLFRGFHFQQGVKMLLKSVEDLYLDELAGITDVLYQLNGEGFPDLKHLHIQNSSQLLYIVNSLDRSDLVKVFPRLESLVMQKLSKLEKICHGQISVASFSELKVIKVKGCNCLKNLFSLSMAAGLSKLVELEVFECNSMEEIIFLQNEETSTDCINIVFGNLHSLKLQNLPVLSDFLSKKKTSSVTQGEEKELTNDVASVPGSCNFLFCEKNLETLSVADCSSLRKIFELNAEELHGNIDMRLKKKLGSIFPASLAKGLAQLQKIYIRECNIDEIVANEENGEAVASFVFPHVTSVKLLFLPKLKSFYKGKHVLECPLLQELEVISCDKLESLGQPHDLVSQPLFSIGKVITSLERMTLNSKEVMRIWNGQFPTNLFCKLKFLRLCHFYDERSSFPYWLLQRIPTLEELFVEYSSFKEIFLSDRLILEDRQIGSVTYLHKIWLWGLHKLENISKEGVDTVLENLEHLCKAECSNLLILAPSKVSFNRLTYLEVKKCESLVKLVTSSTARSLAQLKTMKIKDCKRIEEIVVTDTLEEEIEFRMLQILELECLPNLLDFCSNNCMLKFPFLERLSVKECLRMKIFCVGIVSTPKLQKVLVEGTEDEWYWEGNLNATIKKLFKDKVDSFPSLILPEFLYLGNYAYASHFNLLNILGISCILNTVPSCPNLYLSSFTYHNLTVSHDKALPFDEAVQFLEQWEKDKSYQWVKDRRPSVKFTEAVYWQLQEYERSMYG